MSATNHVSMLAVRKNIPPTSTTYDVKVEYPNLRISMSPCNVAELPSWHFIVSLESSAAASEVFFTLTATLEDSMRSLGDSLTGFACCDQYKYYAFEGVDERVAPSVQFNLTRGQIKALYWR